MRDGQSTGGKGGRPKGARDKQPRRPRADKQSPPNAGKGRPAGAKNVLPYGAASAIRAASQRRRDDLTREGEVVCEMAYQTVVEVMLGVTSALGASSRLAAAKLLLHELNGPLAERIEHTDFSWAEEVRRSFGAEAGGETDG